MRKKKRDAVVLFVGCILLMLLVLICGYNPKELVIDIICGFIGGIIGTIVFTLFRNRQ